MLDRFVNALNVVNDLDSTWWPFALFLRPEPHERMSNLRVLALAVIYGVFAGMFGFAKRDFFEAEPEATEVPKVDLSLT